MKTASNKDHYFDAVTLLNQFVSNKLLWILGKWKLLYSAIIRALLIIGTLMLVGKQVLQDKIAGNNL